MVYIFLTDGFEELEAVAVADVLKRAGKQVSFVSIDESKNKIQGAHGITLSADILLSELDMETAEMLVLPGGLPGADRLAECSELLKLIQDCFERKIGIGAICAAPMVLENAQILQNKRVTCYPGFEKYLVHATTLNERVVIDGNIITAKGPGASIEFALELAGFLCGSAVKEKLAGTMQLN